VTEPTTLPEAPAASRRPRSLFLNRDYMLLWSGQTISTIGTEVSMVAFPFLVLALTGSPAQAGLMGGLRALPYLLFSLPAGALVDRWNRKVVMILSDAGRAVALGSIPVALVLGQLTLAQLYIVSAVEGTLFVFFNLAEVASLPRVVPKEQLPAANAQYSVTEGASVLVGPALGGALFGFAHALPFVADAVSYAVSVLSLASIRARFQGERKVARQRLWREIGEGLTWLWRQPLIRFIALLTGMFNLTSAGFVLIIIVLAQRVHATPFATGLIFTIGGIGGILGSLIASSLQKRLRFGTVIITTSFIWGFLWVAYIFAPNIWAMGAITAASFILNPIYNVTQMSYRLALIPDALQGRVNSVFRLLAFGGQPLGYALTGAALERFGPISTVTTIAAVQLVMATLTALNRHVRHARPIEQLQPTES
jgi:predicted MFS family arabinose efflux permease